MKRMLFIFMLSTIYCLTLITNSFSQEKSQGKFAVELKLGPRIPIGVTRDDLNEGLGIKVGVGYKLADFFEVFHLAFDFGNSSPKNSNILLIQDYYNYDYRLIMETVSIIGFPLTSRFHFHINKSFSGYIGGGGAYYWFSSRLEDPYYGSFQKPRKRSGFGTIIEGALITNFFSERWLVMLHGDLASIKTNGEVLSIQEESDIDTKIKRTDKNLTISIGLRYVFDK